MGKNAIWVVMLLVGLGGCQTWSSGPSLPLVGKDRQFEKQVENDPFPTAGQVRLDAQ